MYCKKCGEKVGLNQKYCNYCGAELEEVKEKAEAPFIVCPVCSEHLLKETTVCPFCGTKLKESTDEDTKTPHEKLVTYRQSTEQHSGTAVVGLIFAIIAMCIIFIFPFIALPLAVIGFVFSLIGFKDNKKLGVIGAVISACSILFFGILFVFAIIFGITDQFYENHMHFFQEEDKEELVTEMEENFNNKKEIYAAWLQDGGDSVLILKEDGTFIYHEDRSNPEKDYIEGLLQTENGINTYGDITYADSSYLYYHLILTNLKIVQNGIDVTNEMNEPQSEYTFGLVRNNYNRSCMQNLSTNALFCFQKGNQAPVVS